MKVVLRETLEHVGRRGEVVSVANGYARNYLFPRKLAYAVTAENLRRIERESRRAAEDEKQRKEELVSLAQRLKEISCTIEAKASEEGHLYGSVTAQMIVEELGREGVELEAKAILLEKPIKETGVFDVKVHLHAEVEAELKVWVIEPKEEGR